MDSHQLVRLKNARAILGPRSPTSAHRLSLSVFQAGGDSLSAVDLLNRNGGSQAPLFALFGRYGHVLRLVPVLRSLGADQPAYAMQPPGMDWNTAARSTLPEMAAYYVGQITRLRPQGPYRLIGVSFGGLVAFEIARQLQRKGELVECLYIVDSAPPNCLFDEAPAFGQSWVIDDGPAKNAIEAINQKIADAHSG